MSAPGANLPPTFGVYACIDWQVDGGLIQPASITLPADVGFDVGGFIATYPTNTSWILETDLTLDSSADSSATFLAEFVGTSNLLSPVDTPYFLNNIAIVQGDGSGGGGAGGAIAVYDEGGLVTADARELDFIGASIAATLQSANRVNVTDSGSTGGSLTNLDGGRPDTVFLPGQTIDGMTP